VEHHSITIPAAVLPSLLLLWYFYSRDVFPEPRGVLLKTFGLGVLAVLPVLLVGLPVLLLFVQPLARISPVAGGVSAAFLTAGVPEEFFKFVVVAYWCARRPEFDEPMDGIVYGATASLGFATMENVLYVSGGSLELALGRGFTAVPCHAFLGAIMGYYVGQARFRPERRRALLATGLGVAMLLHGLYDTPLLVLQFGGEDLLNAHPLFTVGLVALAFGVLLFMGIWTVVLVQRLRHEQLLLQAALDGDVPAEAEAIEPLPGAGELS
jgi:RsiW-degrading membrane proteinase PrsW (M82 family)